MGVVRQWEVEGAGEVMTARQMILTHLTSRPATHVDLVGMLVGKGYPAGSAETMVKAWLEVMIDRNQVLVAHCDGTDVFMANQTYEKEAPTERIPRKSANSEWLDAIAKHKANHP